LVGVTLAGVIPDMVMDTVTVDTVMEDGVMEAGVTVMATDTSSNCTPFQTLKFNDEVTPVHLPHRMGHFTFLMKSISTCLNSNQRREYVLLKIPELNEAKVFIQSG
jgi:hypothetical protein